MIDKYVLEDVSKTAENFVVIAKKIFVTEFTVREVTVCKVAVFLKEVSRQIYFLGIYEIFSITNS